MKAEPVRQQRLLDLQAIDTRLAQIAHARESLPQHEALAELVRRADVLDADLVRATTALGDVQREIDKAEADVQLVRDRADRNQSRLDSGQGTAKDLQALQSELTSLARRQDELEEVQLEVMERAEGIGTEVGGLTTEREELTTRIEAVTAERDSALADLDAEAEQVRAPRDGTAAAVGEDLLALYTKVRDDHGGLGVAILRQGRCGGCQLELNTVELNRIKGAPDDEVIRCEECRRILVRTEESGL